MEARPRPPSAGKWAIFTVVAVGTFVAYLDASIVNIALPTIARDLGADLPTVEWVVTAYLLAVTCLVVTFGRLSDLHGRRRLYVLGMVAFTLGSAFCAGSSGITGLVASRALQGIGAAALLANGSAIVSAAFPETERGKALGMVASVIALGAITGPLLGGFLTEQLGWRSVFLVNLPVGAVGTLLALRVLPHPAGDAPRERFDLLGATLLTACLSALLLLANALARPEAAFAAGGPLAIAVVVLGAGFGWLQTRRAHPLVDLGLFARRAFTAAIASSYLSFWAMASVSFLLPFYLDQALGFGPLEAGAVLAPIPIVLVIVAPLGGVLADRFGSRLVCSVGATINVGGLLCLGTLAADTTMAGVILRLVPFGVGMGLFQPPNASAILGSVPAGRLGIASGMISAIKNLGSLSGVAVTSLLFTVFRPRALEAMLAAGVADEMAARAATAAAASNIYLVSAVVCSLAVVASLVRDEPTG